MLEAPAVVAGFDHVAMVREAVEQRRRHLGVAEDARPFAEGEVGGDDHGRALVESADEMEQQLTASLGDRQIAKFVEHDKVEARQVIGEPAGAPGAGLRLQTIDEVDRVEEAPAQFRPDAAARDGDGQMRLAVSRSLR
jgi:hypothetical protein